MATADLDGDGYADVITTAGEALGKRETERTQATVRTVPYICSWGGPGGPRQTRAATRVELTGPKEPRPMSQTPYSTPRDRGQRAEARRPGLAGRGSRGGARGAGLAGRVSGLRGARHPRLQMRSSRFAVARWIRSSVCPGRSSAGDHANVPDANTRAPLGAR